MLEDAKQWIAYVAVGVEISAAFIIGLAVAQAALRSAAGSFGRIESADLTTRIRLKLARWLALGLEFALAADILRTTVAPTWLDIGQLAAIAALRTGLNFFLAREIESEDRPRFQKLDERRATV
jgi:uncharacterized membrane protein